MNKAIDKWSFDNKKINFDDHIKSSIPLYEETHKLISFLSTFFLKDNSVVYEVGCSTGTLIGKVYDYNNNKNIKYIGLEPSKKLFQIAKKKNKKKKIKFLNKKIQTHKFLKSDLIISHFTMQFIDVEQRMNVLKKIYNSIKVGGGLIFFEKSYFDQPEIDNIISSIYNYDYKRSNSFGINDIFEKSYSLRGIMKLQSENETNNILKKFKFKSISSIFKWGQFTGYLCIK